jgi:type I restriction enzyme S subunit
MKGTGSNDEDDLMRPWSECPLESIARTTSGGTPDRKRPEFYGGTIPWVKSGELNDGYIFSTEETLTPLGVKDSSAKVFPSGTLLMAMYGATVGKTAILKVNAATNQAVCAIFPDQEKVDADFLRYFLIDERQEFLKQRYGGAQPNISQNVIRNFLIRRPPVPEQRKIAAVLRVARRAMEQEAQLLALTLELKKALLHQLFTTGLRGEPQKETEIGPVPKSWEVKPLGEYLCEAQYGLSAKGAVTGPYALLRMTNQQRGRISPDNLQFVDLSAQQFEKFRVKKHDILFNRTNSHELVGRTAIFDLDGDFVFASYLIRLRTNADHLRPHFLNHYFNWDETQVRLKSIAARAVSQSNISASRLRGFSVPVPEPDEQDEIVSQIDCLRAKSELHARKKELLEDLFRTLLHELMTAQIRLPALDLPEKKDAVAN